MGLLIKNPNPDSGGSPHYVLIGDAHRETPITVLLEHPRIKEWSQINSKLECARCWTIGTEVRFQDIQKDGTVPTFVIDFSES